MKRVIWVNTFTCETERDAHSDFYLVFDMPMVAGLGMTIKKAYEANPLKDTIEVFIIDTDTHAELWETLDNWRELDKRNGFRSPKHGRKWVLEQLEKLTLLVTADVQWWCW